MRSRRLGSSWHILWLFGLFCLISGSRWLLEDAVPEARSTLLSAAAGCALAAVVSLSWSFIRQTRGPVAPASQWRAAGAGVLVLGAPALSGLLAGRHISGDGGTLALALTPVVGAVAVSAYGSETGGVAGLLWPGLAGLAGLLLLLPEPALGDWRMDVALFAMPLFAGAGAARVEHNDTAARRKESGPAHNPFNWITLALATGALLFLSSYLATRGDSTWTLSFAAVLADGLSFFFTLFVLHWVGTIRWSAQFLLLPLVTIVEGVILLKPSLTARSWTGMLLLAVGGVYLLLERSDT